MICKDCQAMGEAVDQWARDGRNGNSPPAPPRTDRPLVRNSGGRCASHWRVERQRRKDAAHEKRVVKVYGLPPGGYERLYEFQGGRCAICRRATGASRKLSVDHDHKTGLVRMLACSRCNEMLGHGRDDPEFFRRAAAVLENPPARQLGLEAIHEENR